MKKYLLLTIVFCCLACKTTKNITDNQSKASDLKNVSAKEVLEKHRETFPKFETFSGTLGISFKNEKTTQSLPLSIRVKKNEKIWLSAPLGMAKILLTPEKVQFYNKLNNSYFDGDYSVAKRFLGVELDFQAVQNLLLGQLLSEEEKVKYLLNEEKNSYESTEFPIKKSFQFSNEYRVWNSEFLHLEKGASLRTKYSYQTIENQLFPKNISMEVLDGKQQTDIQLELEISTLNEELKFPYSFPEGYKELIINE